MNKKLKEYVTGIFVSNLLLARDVGLFTQDDIRMITKVYNDRIKK